MSTTETANDTDCTVKLPLKTLREYIAAAEAVADECVIHADDDGFHTKVVDSSNVVMAELTLPADTFDEIEGSMSVGIVTDRLLKVLNSDLDGETVTLDFDADDLRLQASAGARTYDHRAMRAENVRREPDPPTLDLPCEFTVGADRLQSAVTYIDLFSEIIRFEGGEEEGTITVSGEQKKRKDVGDVQWTTDELGSLEGNRANSFFSVDFTTDLVEAIPEDSEVTLELGEEFPVILTYTIADGGEVTFMQAPRIGSD